MTTPESGRAAFANVYDDARRARAYANLDLPGTYYLAFRDLPVILDAPGDGRTAVDFGCGAGRSSRFLRDLGFDTIGIDISAEMIRQAERLDPEGRYLLIHDGEFSQLPRLSVDVILAAFTFDNIPSADHRVRLLTGLRGLLKPRGRLVLVDSTPELYTHDWASFVTTAFPENRQARSGDVVRVVMTDVDDWRPVEDVLWIDEDYRSAFLRSGLQLLSTHRPLATGHEEFAWVNETRIPPWVIYVLGPGRSVS